MLPVIYAEADPGVAYGLCLGGAGTRFNRPTTALVSVGARRVLHFAPLVPAVSSLGHIHHVGWRLTSIEMIRHNK